MQNEVGISGVLYLESAYDTVNFVYLLIDGTYFVRASLFRLSKLCPVSAPLSLFFIIPRD